MKSIRLTKMDLRDLNASQDRAEKVYRKNR